MFPDGGDPFFVDIQEVYDEIGEGMWEGESRWRPGELPDGRLRGNWGAVLHVARRRNTSEIGL